ncbi:MAG: sulfatase/phosphatase domain-containing protein, partial [Planctomycetota bacterium]
VDLNDVETPNPLDGNSVLPLLKDVSFPRNQPAITTYDGHMSVRTETARFIRYWDGTTELYDRTSDPHEWTNQTANPKFSFLKLRLAELLPSKDEVVQPLASRQGGALRTRVKSDADKAKAKRREERKRKSKARDAKNPS